jgi:Co/Zn/Cd efflux system component
VWWCGQRIAALPSFVEVQSQHFWTMTPGVFVGTLHILVRVGASRFNRVHAVVMTYGDVWRVFRMTRMKTSV